MSRALGLALLLLGCSAPTRGGAGPSEVAARDPWIRVRDRATLIAALATVPADAPVVVDVAASWCMPCVELRDISFADPRVAAALRDHIRIELDVTDGTDEQLALQAWLGNDALPHVVRFASVRQLAQALQTGAARPPVTLELRTFVAADELLAALAR